MPAACTQTRGPSPLLAAPGRAASVPMSPLNPLLRPLRLRGQDLLPIVQGGMGVGVSAHRLAGSVAAQGGVGTISSVDLRRHHPDLMARSDRLIFWKGGDGGQRYSGQR